jgi:hypothetical protein
MVQVARELGVNEGTLDSWCAQERRRRGSGKLSESEREELGLLRKENAELQMRCDVLNRFRRKAGRRTRRTSGDVLAVSPLRFLLETGAVRRVRPVPDCTVGKGRRGSSPPAG